MKYTIYKNFLSVESFKKIRRLIVDTEDFPWRKRDHMTGGESGMYFTYCFYNHMKPTSDFYTPFIIPILNQLHAHAAIQVRANMFISAVFKASDWHNDYEFKCKTAILYLNDCDGGTELNIEDKIIFVKAEANKMLVFDTPIFHRAITSQKALVRYIINFNYFRDEGASYRT
jgi:hypothetical protein